MYVRYMATVGLFTLAEEHRLASVVSLIEPPTLLHWPLNNLSTQEACVTVLTVLSHFSI